MGSKTTSDVIIRSRELGAKVYSDIQSRMAALNKRVVQLGVVSGAAAVGGVALLTKQSFSQVDALAKHADRIGASTEGLKAMQILTELTGGSQDKLNQIMVKSQKSLGEFAVTGSGTAAPFLRQLNLDTQELLKLSPDQLFQRYAEEIRGLGTRAEQVAASAALFNDRTGQMLNLIDAGPEAFDEIREQVEKYDLALNRVDSAKVEAANDALLLARQRSEGIGNVIAAKVAPFVTELANQFLATGGTAEEMGDTVDRVIDAIGKGVGFVGDAFRGWQLIFGLVETELLFGAANIVGGLAKVETAAIEVKNAIGEILPGEREAADPNKGFLRQVELSLRASAGHARTQLEELAATEKPSEKIAAALKRVREEAQAAAENAAAMRQNIQESFGDPTFEESEIAQREREREEQAAQRLREGLRRKLDTVIAGVLEEEQIAAQAFLRRQEIVTQAQEAELISEERAQTLKLELRRRFEEELTKIAKKGETERMKFQALSNKAKAKDVFTTLESITAGVASNNKTLFRINQAAAIANAIINTHEGVTKTLAKYPWPLAGILAAVHLAAGVARIAAIRSTSFGGGTTPSAAGDTPTFEGQPIQQFDTDGGGGGGASANPRLQPQITIVVQGNLIGDQGIKDVVAGAVQELAEEDVLIIPPDSRAAEEIRQGTGSGG